MRNRVLLTLALVVALGATACSVDPFEAAKTAFNEGDYAEALRLWRPLADSGHAEAQSYMGLMYSEGKGVPQDQKEAVQWFRKAADQGLAQAMFNLGGCYAMGLGVEVDCFEAYMLFYQAEAAGIRDASDGIDFCETQLSPEQLREATDQAEQAVQASRP